MNVYRITTCTNELGDAELFARYNLTAIDADGAIQRAPLFFTLECERIRDVEFVCRLDEPTQEKAAF